MVICASDQNSLFCQSLNSSTDISALAKEIINKCKLIHPSKVPEVEQLLYYLQNRKEKSKETAASLETTEDGGDGATESLRVQSASLHRYSPLPEFQRKEDDATAANINYLDDYIELLYEEVGSKVKGSGLILQLAR